MSDNNPIKNYQKEVIIPKEKNNHSEKYVPKNNETFGKIIERSTPNKKDNTTNSTGPKKRE